MINDTLKVTGEVAIELFDNHGDKIDGIVVPNLVVTTGKGFIASSMVKTTSNSPAAMTHMAIGFGTTTQALGNTNLVSEQRRNAFDGGYPSVSGAVVTYRASFAAGQATGAVTEAGIFNYSTYTGTPTSSQILLCRTTFAAINKADADSMTVTWTITIA